MPKLKDESFQAVSRGLIAHLADMTNAQAKLYLYCLLRAKNNGDKKGSFTNFAADISDGVGWGVKAFYKVLKGMSDYLDVKYGKSRHWPMTIKIKKFKALPDFYCHTIVDSKGDGKYDSKGTVRGQLGDGNSCNSNYDNDLKTPKKVKREKGNIEERSKLFYEECSVFLKEYGPDMLRGFYEYWTEENKTKTKMRFELEKTWDLTKRLARWAKNNKSFQPSDAGITY